MPFTTARYLILALLAMVIAACCSESGDEFERECFLVETSSDTTYIRDYQYQRYTVFEIGRIGDTRMLADGDSILEFQLFTTSAYPSSFQVYAIAYPDWRDTTEGLAIAEWMYPPAHTLLPERNYLINRDPSSSTNATLAYFLIIARVDGSVDTIGDISSDVLKLQLLKRPNTLPDDPLWQAEARNAYRLNLFAPDHIQWNLSIHEGAVGTESDSTNPDNQAGVPYLELLRLDVTDPFGGGPDGFVDENTLILDGRLVIFPARHPFADPVLEHPADGIYVEMDPSLAEAASRYYLRIVRWFNDNFTTLDRGDIRRGSVEVQVNGRPLLEGESFRVDYYYRQLAIYDPAALNPDSVVSVCYEYFK